MRKNILKLMTTAFTLLPGYIVFAQDTLLKDSLENYLKTKNADVGISIYLIETQKEFSMNGNKRYPMQSTYKFPQALAILDLVDKNKLSLEQKIHVSTNELRPNTWSPLREKFPKGDLDITVAELLEYSVSKSDNNACDILFKLLGGTKKNHKYIRKLGIKDMSIIATEKEMATKWALQYKNYSSPNAMTQLLKGFYKKEYLSATNTDFLMKLMTESSNSANRIKALLPKEALVAHKTGTSNTNAEGLRPALNDVGIITLPNGQHLILSIFISNATHTYEEGEKMIAQISKIIWDFYRNP